MALIKEDISLYDGFMEVHAGDYSNPLKLNFFWLRENCSCSKCFNVTTNQRNLTVLDLPEDIKPSDYKLSDGQLIIHWNDGHKSVYPINWLLQYTNLEIFPDPILWSGRLTEAVTLAHNDLNSQPKITNLVESLLLYGVGFVKNVEPTLEATENVVTSIFPVQQTFFGGMWEFGNDLSFLDTAYTSKYIGAHTDNTYFNDAAGLQVFHLLKFDGEGGETLLVDGFKTVADMYSQQPEYVQCLRTVSVESHYTDETRHMTSIQPILRYNTDNTIRQIRYNLYDRSPRVLLSGDQQGLFFKSLRYLAKLMQDPKREWWLKLEPGTVIFINNWRVLHGRASYKGARKMSGCYVSMGDFLSKARHLKVIR